MSFSPRRVRTTHTVVLYECRLLKSSLKPASVLRYVEGKVKKWRGVQRWYLQCYLSPRGEVVIQAVVERVAAVCRVDNLIQAWRKIVVKMIPSAPLANQLKRGVWCQDMLVEVRVMVEHWESACAKLGAEASVDGGAVKCSYLVPALPSTMPALPIIALKSHGSSPAIRDFECGWCGMFVKDIPLCSSASQPWLRPRSARSPCSTAPGPSGLPRSSSLACHPPLSRTSSHGS